MTRIYGQTGIFGSFVRKTWSKPAEFLRTNGHFDHFVRNRHFSGKPVTDKLSIFSDLSVNGSDFDKCSAAHHLLNYRT